MKPARRCTVVAEVAQAHDGSLGMAHAFIDAVADAGADAVKFQTHIAGEESTPEEPWRVKFSLQDATRYDYWKRMEFTKEQWYGLKTHALAKNLLFFSSPFSMAAVDLLEELDIPVWKVASGEMTNKPLIDRMIRTGKPIWLSTGMCTTEELDHCVGWVRQAGNELVILQCTSEYPCPPERVGLHWLSAFQSKYRCPVGLSDHSGTIYPGIVAAAMGAAVVEVHVTFSRQAFGPDVSSSVTMEQLKQLAEGVDFAARLTAGDRGRKGDSEHSRTMRSLFHRSLAARADLPAGTVLEESMVVCKKPGIGIPPGRLPEFIGRTLRKDVAKDRLFAESDFECERPRG